MTQAEHDTETKQPVQHVLPPLPYGFEALEPYISRETLEYHYGKHHAGYVKKLNELIKGTELEDLPLAEIIRQARQGPVFNNAAQAWNHSFYWNCMSPAGGGQPVAELARAIDRAFGSFDAFKRTFAEQADGLFGSGWAWLVQRADGALAIELTANAGTPLASDQHVLMTCDVWEHAYYLDYRNDRDEYLDAFWEVVNWEFVAGNLRG